MNYRLEADGEAVPDGADIKFETFEYEGEDSRFFELDYLSGKKEPNELYDYLLRAFFVDEFMTRL